VFQALTGPLDDQYGWFTTGGDAALVDALQSTPLKARAGPFSPPIRMLLFGKAWDWSAVKLDGCLYMALLGPRRPRHAHEFGQHAGLRR